MFKIIILILFFIFLFIEILLILLVKSFKKEFKWIIEKKDELPVFNREKLNSFFAKSFNNIYGWDRRPLSKGFEYSDKETKFKICKNGYRGNLKLEKTKSISVFGDSFAFCRYVDDHATWENFLEKKINSNILNFGVGNFGLDQSYLKYCKYKKHISSQIVIFNVVPETIARINSYWKHYREFGNIHGFKPLIKIENGLLKKKEILLKKSYSDSKIQEKIKYVKFFDIFYDLKFNKLSFKFPYTFIFFKNFMHYNFIFLNLILNKITKKDRHLHKAINIVLKKNIAESHQMYNEKLFKKKLKDLILFINKQIKKDNRKMIIVVSPQLLDLKLKTNINYKLFFKSISNQIYCLDLTNDFEKKTNYQKLFFKDIYGGHLNKYGNKFVSDIIFKFLKKTGLA